MDNIVSQGTSRGTQIKGSFICVNKNKESTELKNK